MNKKLFILMAMLTMSFASCFAQDVRFSGNIGVTASVEPHNSNYIAFPEQLNLGIGARWDTGFYLGGGIAPGFHVDYAHAGGESKTETSFIMPFYLQASYIKPQGYYADFKIGGEDLIVNGNSVTLFFVNITPLGYSFDEHNSIGLGWRYHHKNNFTGHAISLTYQYTF